MAFALAKEQKKFIRRVARSGRFNDQTEVVCDALRPTVNDELSYLLPPPLTAAQVKTIYVARNRTDDHECRFGKAAFAAVRRANLTGSARNPVVIERMKTNPNFTKAVQEKIDAARASLKSGKGMTPDEFARSFNARKAKWKKARQKFV
jgi:hypothetical protein